jgi:hypothetical protein
MIARCINMRAQTAFLLTAAAMSLIGCRDDATAQRPVAPTLSRTAPANVESDANASHEFGEFSFAIPSGWTVVTPDRDKTKAMIVLDGTSWQNAKAMIKVDVGTPTAPTAKQLAEGFANNARGTVSAESLDFDGTSAVSASTSSTTLAVPRNMIIVYRDGKAYLLMAGAVEGIDLSKAISHVRKSWKWTKQ